MLAVQFPADTYEITSAELKQWDKGQELKIVASSVATPYEVHFANRGSQTALRVEATAIDDITCTVKIPDIILTSEQDAIAWVYTVEGDVGTTVKRINIPIEKRAKPEDYVYDPHVPSVTVLPADITLHIDMPANTVPTALTIDNVSYDTNEVINAAKKLFNGENINVHVDGAYYFWSGGPWKTEINVSHFEYYKGRTVIILRIYFFLPAPAGIYGSLVRFRMDIDVANNTIDVVFDNNAM